MIRITDQMGRTIELPASPKRIVSLVPSQTELLYDLDLQDEVVGITKFCIHPDTWFRSKTRIGGTKNVNLEKVRSLAPDLIIANKEENTQTEVEALALEYPVWISDINDFETALDMIQQIGMVTGKAAVAKALSNRIAVNFSSLTHTTMLFRTAYLIWKNPYMSVGGDTFISSMLKRGGFLNIYESRSRYPQVTVSDLKTANCGLLLLSSEPYPFKQADIDELQADLPDTLILLVDGEMFSWYGSRLLQAPAYFRLLRQQIEAMP